MSKTLTTIADTKAANVALGVAPGSVSPSPTKQFSFYSVTIPNGTSYPVVMSGDFIYITEISVAATGNSFPLPFAFTAKPNNGVAVPIVNGNTKLRWQSAFEFLLINNAAGNGDVVLSFYCGFGAVELNSIASIAMTPSFGPVGAAYTLPNPAKAAYAINDSVGTGGLTLANVFSVGSVRSNITSARLLKNSQTIANANFTVYLMSGVLPGIVDGSPFILNYNFGVAQLVGVISFPLFVCGGVGAGSDAAYCYVSDISIRVNATTSNRNLYACIVANAPYVPTNSELFRLDLGGNFN